MRIACINTQERLGGAARAVHRLHRAFRDAGHQSEMVVLGRQTGDPTVHLVGHDLAGAVARELCLKSYGLLKRTLVRPEAGAFSLSAWPLPVAAMRSVIEADVVLLGWVSALLAPSSLRAVLDSKKPVVWRLSDMEPFTGGCHFALSCEAYRARCGRCPRLRFPGALDASRMQHSAKAWALESARLTAVAPSQWIAERARVSSLFRRFAIRHIPTAVDFEVFRPLPAADARELLGLDPAAEWIGFVAAGGLSDARKGGKDAVEVVRRLRAQGRDARLLLVGAGGDETVRDLPVVDVGALGDDLSIALAYAAMDAVLVPSAGDNLPNVAVEALACGRPVFGYAIGGIAEVVTDAAAGGLVPAGRVDDLTEAVVRFLAGARAGSPATARATVERFALTAVRDQYLALFEEMSET
jgi:glycosyltransferase involved in cell wall biosynthesis